MKGNIKEPRAYVGGRRGESSRFFVGPKGYIGQERGGRDLGIFPRPKASMEEIKSRACIGRGSKSLYRGGELEIFLNPKASLEREYGEI